MNILSIETEGGFLKFGPKYMMAPKPKGLVIVCATVITLGHIAIIWACHTKSLGMWASGVQSFVSMVATVEIFAVAALSFVGIKKQQKPMSFAAPSYNYEKKN